MNPSENVSRQAGDSKCQAQEKASCVSGKACNAAQSAQESCQEAGQQMKAKAQDASEAVKSTVGAHK